MNYNKGKGAKFSTVKEILDIEINFRKTNMVNIIRKKDGDVLWITKEN